MVADIYASARQTQGEGMKPISGYFGFAGLESELPIRAQSDGFLGPKGNGYHRFDVTNLNDQAGERM